MAEKCTYYRLPMELIIYRLFKKSGELQHTQELL